MRLSFIRRLRQIEPGVERFVDADGEEAEHQRDSHGPQRPGARNVSRVPPALPQPFQQRFDEEGQQHADQPGREQIGPRQMTDEQPRALPDELRRRRADRDPKAEPEPGQQMTMSHSSPHARALQRYGERPLTRGRIGRYASDIGTRLAIRVEGGILRTFSTRQSQ